jgi:hypothetical protein
MDKQLCQYDDAGKHVVKETDAFRFHPLVCVICGGSDVGTHGAVKHTVSEQYCLEEFRRRYHLTAH